MPKLKPDFYLQEDVLSLAQQLLGKVLYTHIDGVVTAGKIVETEACNGREGREIWIQDESISVQSSEIIVSPKVGVVYAAEHAFLP